MPRKHQRVHLPWIPEWDEEIRTWTLRFIYKNRWRCDRIHEADDLLQDAFLIFDKIRTKYPRVVDKRHFMALYKRAIINRTHDMSLYVKRKREIHQDTTLDVSDLYAGNIGELTNAGYANALLAEAPEELRIALRLLQTNPEVLRGLPKTKERLNLNEKLRRLLNLPDDFDFSLELKQLFT